MKEVKVEKVVTENLLFTKYVAVDGTEFEDAAECKAYEKSALCAVKSRISDKLIRLDDKTLYHNGLDELIDEGRSESEYYAFKAETEEDLKNFVQFLKLENLNESDTYLCGENVGNLDYVRSYEILSELKVGVQYLVSMNYSIVVYSEEHLLNLIRNGFKTMFDKYEKPKANDDDKASKD